MINPQEFHSVLQSLGVEFYAGVPDSLLKEFGAYIDDVIPPSNHQITANEGTAIAIAAGYHLATGTVPLVYMQNSGLGNSINPLLSLVDPEVYSIPVLLLIGWRGEPSVKDEPQHVKQGRVTREMLDAMDIPFEILDPSASPEAIAVSARTAIELAISRGGPTALLVRKGVFEKSSRRRAVPVRHQLSREQAIATIVESCPPGSTFVCTTGKASRELYEIRENTGVGHGADFLTVGSMGHASQIAFGLSIAAPDRTIICLDGDGAAIMQMGGLTSIGTGGARKLVHLVLNNGVHESVGGQPTAGFRIDLSGIAAAAGFRNVLEPADSAETLRRSITGLCEVEGPSFLEVLISANSRADLGRPKETPQENKKLFVEHLRATKR